jgi:16S rRNA (uracil1498-N3)-methyltransferase
MAAGEEITVCDMQGNEYNCKISAFDDDKEVIAEILSQKKSENEPKVFITLYQALPKGDKLDTIIQKAVECGVFEITTFESERCVVRSKADSEEKKIERRSRIALEAAKQCGRGIIPKVNKTLPFNRMLEIASSENDLLLFCYEGNGVRPLREVLIGLGGREWAKGKNIAVIIGSEGGFSYDEAKRAEECGAILVGLGSRILRTETASPFALACLVYEFEL